MLDTRSKFKKVDDEKRKHPRLELHCQAVVRGMNGIFKVTDISLGGVFIEPQSPVIVKVGQVTDIKIKLPEASNSIQAKVRFANQNKRGIGCEFIHLTPANQKCIEDCLETFRYTMPITRNQKPTKAAIPKASKKMVQCPQCKRVKSVTWPEKDGRAIRVKLKCSCGHRWFLTSQDGTHNSKAVQNHPARAKVNEY